MSTPVFQAPGQWATMHVRGEAIIPDTTYTIQAQTTEASTAGVSTATWVWGDVTNDRVVSLDDMMWIIAGFQGDFSLASLENVDLYPCVPDGIVSLGDILWWIQAFQGGTYVDTQCPMPCP